MSHPAATFTCAKCGDVFDKDEDQTEEDKVAEMRRNVGEVDEADKITICDDCYNAFMKWWKPQTN